MRLTTHSVAVADVMRVTEQSFGLSGGGGCEGGEEGGEDEKRAHGRQLGDFGPAPLSPHRVAIR